MAKSYPAWRISYLWGKTKPRPRKQFGVWHIPRDQLVTEVSDGTFWRVQVTGAGHQFEFQCRITSGEEVLLLPRDAQLLRVALRKNRKVGFTMKLVQRLKRRTVI